jgi:TRAP-type C4-dicarboxylate transport system permease small subunit
MTRLFEHTPDLGISLAILGVFGYAIALVLAAFFSRNPGSLGAWLRTWFASHPGQNLGIPCSAISAYAIVAALSKASPDTADRLEFKAFGLVFSGPSGPITLWLMCFLAFIVSIKLLRTDALRQKRKAETDGAAN